MSPKTLGQFPLLALFTSASQGGVAATAASDQSTVQFEQALAAQNAAQQQSQTYIYVGAALAAALVIYYLMKK